MAESSDRSNPKLFIARARFAAVLMLLVLPVIGHAQAPIAQAPVLRDAWGVRLGALAVPEYPGAHPLFQPYYETATSDASPLTMIGDLTIAFTQLSSIDIPTFQDFSLVDYGFHAGVRYAPQSAGKISPFGAVALGFDVYPDPGPNDPGRVAASFPITLGALYDFSHSTQFEFAAIAMPQWYFRQGWAFSYGISIGGRFLNVVE